MSSSWDPTETVEQTPVDPGRLVLLGLDTPLADAWARAAQAIGLQCAIASCVDECVAYAWGGGPTILAVLEPGFQPRMVSRSDAAFGRTTLVVLTKDIEPNPFWRLIAWDAISIAAGSNHLIEVLTTAHVEAERRLAECLLVEDIRRRQASLGEKEQRVLKAICAGRLNKQIAKEQSVSVRTIEQRRRRVFEKMGVESAVPLAAKMAVVQSLEDQALRNRHPQRKDIAGESAPPKPKLPVGLFSSPTATAGETAYRFRTARAASGNRAAEKPHG